jgi:site-specific recombinase XerD
MTKETTPNPTSVKLESYQEFMKANEYRDRTIREYQKYIHKFLTSAFYEGCNLKSQIQIFVKDENEHHPQAITNCRAAIYSFYKMETGNIFRSCNNSLPCSPEIELMLKGFYEYTCSVKHLTLTTAMQEVSHVRRFLSSVYKSHKENLQVIEIKADDIRQYFVNAVNQLRPGTKGRLATSVRNFFHYLEFTGMEIHKSIFNLPLSPAVWKSANVPVVFTEEEIQSLLKTFRRDTPTSVRNYAIMLCFTELGLRCLEVANLTLDNFCWYESSVNIRNTKTHTDRKLPLSSITGNAIAEYIKLSRPETTERILFVRFSHTKGKPMGRGQIRGAVRSAYDKAGISNSRGTHILRKTTASRIYNNGNSLKMVADILGHESIDSTVIYTKVNVNKLSRAAGKWPGGEEYDD